MPLNLRSWWELPDWVGVDDITCEQVNEVSPHRLFGPCTLAAFLGWTAHSTYSRAG